MRRSTSSNPPLRRPRLRTFVWCVVAVVGIALTTTAVAVESELTLSFDGEPHLAEWHSIQPGFNCANGVVAGVNKQPQQAFVRDGSVKRHGLYSAHVYLRPGDNTAYTCTKEAVLAIRRLSDGEGSEAWYGWSWRFPASWPGSNSWGEVLGFTTYHPYWPSYGQFSFDAADRNNLVLRLKTGHIPSPGSSSYNPTPPNGYKADQPLLGTSGARPFTKDVWHDFYMHIVWRSRTNGVLTIWHREEGAAGWQKLYDNTGAGDALINRSPHPTLMYNDAYGAPGEAGRPGLELHAGFYRAAESATVDYWFDGFRRRQSGSATLAEFPESPSEVPPPGERPPTAPHDPSPDPGNEPSPDPEDEPPPDPGHEPSPDPGHEPSAAPAPEPESTPSSGAAPEPQPPFHPAHEPTPSSHPAFESPPHPPGSLGRPVPEPPATRSKQSARPKISGSVRVGFTLTTRLDLATRETTLFSFRWQSCNASGSACKTIRGANGPSYKPRIADIGRTFRVVVVTRNGARTRSGTSLPTGVVQRAP